MPYFMHVYPKGMVSFCDVCTVYHVSVVGRVYLGLPERSAFYK